MAQRDMSCITSLSYEALVSYVVIQLFFFLITGFIKFQEHVTLRRLKGFLLQKSMHPEEGMDLKCCVEKWN